MLTRLPDRAAALVFVAVVLLTSAATSRVAEGLVLALSPALTVLVMLLVITREGWTREGWRRLGLGRAGLRWWPAAVASTAGVSLVACALVVTLGWARLTGPTDDAAVVLVSLLVTGTLLALCEEVGWRGYLQPRLVTWLGRGRSFAVVGVVWVAWHLPYVLLTPWYHAAGDRWVVLPLFSASVLAFSALFGVLRERSGSTWPAVVGHVAHNAAFAWLASSVVTATDPVVADEYLAGDTGLFVLVGTTAAAVVVAGRGARGSR
ncbi:CPBP family intramembrane glutamic endopeptidase [Quadrisphaera setariae]|uniref:CPBP family intramembrane metalloprotease n=1 Tax=Quadrisphaera setariae TaxID=2593304 RepID=A0A5C8Z413_9ACTN|nr:CPBP family intramembrane glutamic endopeptidase [Quadrisphaera setariae]TXR52832.1 CPBP family intramembrane metalloprotease [Quadrisphaera setariae]